MYNVYADIADRSKKISTEKRYFCSYICAYGLATLHVVRNKKNKTGLFFIITNDIIFSRTQHYI